MRLGSGAIDAVVSAMHDVTVPPGCCNRPGAFCDRTRYAVTTPSLAIDRAIKEVIGEDHAGCRAARRHEWQAAFKRQGHEFARLERRQRFCEDTYTRLSAKPLIRGSDPDATIRMLRIGRIKFSRFCFGTPTRAEDFDPAAGNIIVVNTLRGGLRHPLDGNAVADTRSGDSYVVDCSRIDYWNIADGHDLQLNLTIPHALIEAVAARWYGFVPDDSLWRRRLVFGRRQSAWLSLVDYATRSLEARHDGIAHSVIEQRIEEALCLELLQ